MCIDNYELPISFNNCFFSQAVKWPSVVFCLQKLKATLNQQLSQVSNGDGGEVQSSAVTHTVNPTSPAPTPTPAPAAILTPAPQLPTTEEASTHSLQQPATSTTETPVGFHVNSQSFILKPSHLGANVLLSCASKFRQVLRS